jgi:predicted lipoprotein with Yx(FWY)xxD motif
VRQQQLLRILAAVQGLSHRQTNEGEGVKGSLSKLHRAKGNFYQVTLKGHPLYRYAPDNGKRSSAKGEGIKSFGGTWHVVPAS